jgi:hypothetical protein
LKFGDVITAVASMFVLIILIGFLLNFALIPMNTYWGGAVSNFVSVLVSALIVGYVFAGKIREESKMISIGKIVVLSAFVMVFALMMMYGAIGHYSAEVDETLRNTYSTWSSWTNTDWFAYEMMELVFDAALFAVSTLAFGFIGLYLGSMLRKPSAKT